ncbi:MAG: universal stress protein [Comamonas sp.]
MRILLAVDGSAYTRKMLEYLGSHPHWLAAPNEYTALTVGAPLPPHAAKMLSKDVVSEYYDEEAQKVLAPVREFLAGHQVEAQCISKVGPIGETISRVADEGGYDLLVMGTRGHSALAKLVVGSVATQVLAASKVPVLLIR